MGNTATKPSALLRRAATVAALLSLPVAGALAWSLQDAPIDRFDRVELGMTASEVRARFPASGVDGRWQTSATEEGTVLLDWEPAGDSAVRSARFEVHQGALVAIRANLAQNHANAGDPSRATADVLRHAAPADDGGTQVLWITRNCPVHQDEVEALLGDL
ncbi:MAG: hypothetical protein AAF938_06905 [Myxococcota bacterium]